MGVENENEICDLERLDDTPQKNQENPNFQIPRNLSRYNTSFPSNDIYQVQKLKSNQINKNRKKMVRNYSYESSLNNVVPLINIKKPETELFKNKSSFRLLIFPDKDECISERKYYQKKSIEKKEVFNVYSERKISKGISLNISNKELVNLLKKYKPLNDGIPVEVKSKFIGEDKSIYFGEWDKRKKVRHGRGIQLWPDGRRYEGQWKDGEVNGKGKLYHSNGNTYEGDWKNNMPNGEGCFTYTDGSKYEGEWKDDKPNGRGKETLVNGSYFIGTYKNGKKNGYGEHFWIDGSKFEGNYADNNMYGKGKLTYPDNRQYNGEWVNNKFEGKGIFTWPDGRKYIGEYKNDKKEGYGVFQWGNGKIYKGLWKNGKQHGQGEFFSPREEKWQKGEWENGKLIKWLDE